MLVSRTVALILLSVSMAACGGHRTAARHGRSVTGGDPNPVVFGGRLASIGGGRSLYLKCQGRGSPTVILEAGVGAGSEDWSDVQPRLARATRTCAYDRAGLGNSLPVLGAPFPGVHDASDDVSDLERLLDHAAITSPYVLVGRSYGGLLVRLFAHARPHRTAGMVLVDTEALDAKLGGLGNTPLVIITPGRPIDSGPPVPASVQRLVERRWATMQDELAGLSSDHLHVIALRSGHVVQPSLNGQPDDVVIAAVLAVLNAARTRTPLPPCPTVFHRPGMQCRS
jgi:pimeloyl-ACP methyl ester carboxylesterase